MRVTELLPCEHQQFGVPCGVCGGVEGASLNSDKYSCVRCLQVHDSLSKAPPTNARMLAKSRTKDGHRLTWRQPAGADSLGGISEGGDCGRDSSGPDQSGETGFRSTRGQTVLVNAWAGSKGIMDYFVLRTYTHPSPPSSPSPPSPAYNFACCMHARSPRGFLASPW